jgi:hypothetical protein
MMLPQANINHRWTIANGGITVFRTHIFYWLMVSPPKDSGRKKGDHHHLRDGRSATRYDKICPVN